MYFFHAFLTVQFLQVFMLMENYCNVCLYLCIWSATNADIFTCIILFHLNYKLSLSCRRWCFYFEIKYIFILLEWWTTRFKHVVKWLRWLVVGLSQWSNRVAKCERSPCGDMLMNRITYIYSYGVSVNIRTTLFPDDKC